MTITNLKGTEVRSKNCILRRGKKAKITTMCNPTCDSFQEIPIQQFSGNGVPGLLLPLSMSGKRKDCWMLGKLTEHMDREQAKNCYKKCSLPFQHTCIHRFHFPMLLDPKTFPRLQDQPDQNELKLNQQIEDCS